MYEYSDYDGWESYNAWTHRHDEPRPRCDYCGEVIEDDWAYEMPNGDLVCEECIEEYVSDNFRKPL